MHGDNALADYRSADNLCHTIGRLPINTKVPETGQKPAVHIV